jgi:hypothetical protein
MTTTTIFDNLIPSRNFRLIKDLVKSILETELAKQKEIAKDLGQKPEWIAENIDFNIYADRFKPINKDERPVVVIDIANTEYNIRYSGRARAKSTLQFYLFADGMSKSDESGIIGDDEIASQRLDYLLSQVMSIVSAEFYFDLQTYKDRYDRELPYISRKSLMGFKRVYLPEGDNQNQTTLGYLLEYEIEYNEFFEEVKGIHCDQLLFELTSKKQTFPFLTINKEQIDNYKFIN